MNLILGQNFQPSGNQYGNNLECTLNRCTVQCTRSTCSVYSGHCSFSRELESHLNPICPDWSINCTDVQCKTAYEVHSQPHFRSIFPDIKTPQILYFETIQVGFSRNQGASDFIFWNYSGRYFRISRLLKSYILKQFRSLFLEIIFYFLGTKSAFYNVEILFLKIFLVQIFCLNQ